MEKIIKLLNYKLLNYKLLNEHRNI